MRKLVFGHTAWPYYASTDEFNSIIFWNRNFISLMEYFAIQKIQLKLKFTEFENSKICKNDKTDTLYSIALSGYIREREAIDDIILKTTREYAENIFRIERMNQ